MPLDARGPCPMTYAYQGMAQPAEDCGSAALRHTVDDRKDPIQSTRAVSTNSWSVCFDSTRNLTGKRFCRAKAAQSPRKPRGCVVSLTAPLGCVNSLAKYAASHAAIVLPLTSSGIRILPRHTRLCPSVFQ